MKKLIQYLVLIILIGCIGFSSCKKEKPITAIVTLPPPPNPQLPLPPFSPITDSLSGREFLYENLTWQTWGAPYVEIEIPDSHLFLNRGIEVSIDSSSTWINIPFYTVEFGIGTLPLPANNGYIYDNNYFDSVFLFAISSNNAQLVGTKASVIIKIL